MSALVCGGEEIPGQTLVAESQRGTSQAAEGTLDAYLGFVVKVTRKWKASSAGS